MTGRELARRVALIVLLLGGASASVRAGDGDLDQSWGFGGIGNGYDGFTALAGTASGAGFMLLTGVLPSDPHELIHAYPDPPGTGGHIRCRSSWIPGGLRYEGRAMLEDRDGRLLVAGAVGMGGSITTDRAFVVRFPVNFCTPLDPGFHGQGWQRFDETTFCDTESCRIVGMAEKAGGTTRYVLLLERTVNFLRADYYLVGLDEDGDLDTTFGNLGYRQVTATNFGNTVIAPTSLVVDELDRIYVLHSHSDVDDVLDIDVGLTRFSSGGIRDTTYGSLGTRFLAADDNLNEFSSALAIGPDGRIAASWREQGVNQIGRIAVYSRGGGPSGAVEDYYPKSELAALQFDGLGRLLITIDRSDFDGYTLKRLLPMFGVGLLFDPDFGEDGAVYVDVDAGGGDGEVPVALALEAGRICVLVDADHGLGERTAVQVRHHVSLVFADGFEWGSTKFW